MVQCLIDFPMQFLSTMRSLLLPQDSSQTHPLIVKMILLPVPLSGHQSKQEIFQRKLAKLSAIHGDQNHEAIPRASPEMKRNLCSMEKKSIYTLFYLCNTFTSNVRLKFAKNQTKAKQNLEAKLLLFKNCWLSLSKLSYNNKNISKKCTKNKYVCLNEVI